MLAEIFSLIWLTVLLLGSPGPAPLTLAAVGSSFEFSVGLKFLSGILIGLAFVILLSLFGNSVLSNASPKVALTLKIASAFYLLLIAYKIAFARSKTKGFSRPPSALDGFLLNLFNPKAYAAFFALFSSHKITHETLPLGLLYTGIISFLVAVVVDFAWLYFGSLFSKNIQNSLHDKWIRLSLGALIVSTLLASYL